MRLIVGIVAAALLGSGVAAAEDLDSAALSAAIERARAGQVDVLAPNNFAEAVEAQQSAAKDAARGRSAEKVRARVQEGEAALQRAAAAADSARKLMGSVIKTREDALTAEAPKFA